MISVTLPKYQADLIAEALEAAVFETQEGYVVSQMVLDQLLEAKEYIDAAK